MSLVGIKDRAKSMLPWIALLLGALNLAMDVPASEVVVAAFSAGLREEVDLEDLQAQILAVVEETLQPEVVSLWLRPGEKMKREAIL